MHVLSWVPRAWALLVSAALVGADSSIGMIALQRTAGRLAGSASERLRIFSWIALAPSIANLVGPMLAGLLIDHVGFRAAFAALVVLPLLTLVAAWQVPRKVVVPPTLVTGAVPTRAWDLLGSADFRRLLFINWLISASWDAHSFALPILGHGGLCRYLRLGIGRDSALGYVNLAPGNPACASGRSLGFAFHLRPFVNAGDAAEFWAGGCCCGYRAGFLAHRCGAYGRGLAGLATA